MMALFPDTVYLYSPTSIVVSNTKKRKSLNATEAKLLSILCE